MRYLSLVLCLPLVVKAAVPAPPTTSFTRGLLRTTNQTEALTYLGASSSSSSVTDTSTNTLQNKTLQSTLGGGNNTIKLKNYIVLAFPHSCDGVGAIISTNDNTLAYTGQAAFSGTAATNGNYVEYRITVPEDVDTAVDMKVE